MNILIKLTCLIGLVIAPILGGHSATTEISNHSEEIKKEIIIEQSSDINVKATIKTSNTVDGITITEEVVIEGTLEEVKAQIKELSKIHDEDGGVKVEKEIIIEETHQ